MPTERHYKTPFRLYTPASVLWTVHSASPGAVGGDLPLRAEAASELRPRATPVAGLHLGQDPGGGQRELTQNLLTFTPIFHCPKMTRLEVKFWDCVT